MEKHLSYRNVNQTAMLRTDPSAQSFDQSKPAYGIPLSHLANQKNKSRPGMGLQWKSFETMSRKKDPTGQKLAKKLKTRPLTAV